MVFRWNQFNIISSNVNNKTLFFNIKLIMAILYFQYFFTI